MVRIIRHQNVEDGIIESHWIDQRSLREGSEFEEWFKVNFICNEGVHLCRSFIPLGKFNRVSDPEDVSFSMRDDFERGSAGEG